MDLNSDRNASIARRFEDEHTEDRNWSDSEASEGEREDMIGELHRLKEIKGSQRVVFPLHIILAIDSSKSMQRCDVDGKRRLDAVLHASRRFIEEQRSKVHAANAKYSLLTFGSEAVLHCKYCSASDLSQRLIVASNELLPKGHSLFSEAFSGALSLLEQSDASEANADMFLLLFSAGQPRESPDTLVKLLQKTLLNKPCTQMLHWFIIHTVGFGSGNQKVRLMPGQYSRGLVIGRHGKVRSLSAQSERLGLKIGSQVLRINGAVYSSESLEEHMNGVDPFTLSVEASGDVEKCLEPLSARTGGTYQVAQLTGLDLSRAFSSVGSSIEQSRMSGSLAPPIHRDLAAKFDSSGDDDCCIRDCLISKLTRRKDDFKVHEVAFCASCTIDQKPFGHGAMRLVYRMKDNSHRNNGEQMVAKRLIGREHADKGSMLPFCKNTSRAFSFRDSFLSELRSVDMWTDLKIVFVPCYLYEYKHSAGNGWFVGEQMLEGPFVKFNNNDGWKNEAHSFSEVMQALSHFSLIHSRGRFMLVDLQGTVDRMTVLLTDPQILSKYPPGSRSEYGFGDLGPNGFRSFLSSHKCGATCKRLNLDAKMNNLIRELSLDRPPNIDHHCASRLRVGHPCRPQVGFTSATVHDQVSGTCYANAVATIVREAEKRILGRVVEPHDSLVKRIVKRHCSSGGCCQLVLAEECPPRCLRFRNISAPEVSKCIQAGRSVLVGFWLTSVQWDEFSRFFRSTPKGVLTKLAAPTSPRPKTEGHACVVAACYKETYTVKNSWGKAFGDDGLFRIEKSVLDALSPKSTYIDVYFNEHDLRDIDRRAYQQMQQRLHN